MSIYSQSLWRGYFSYRCILRGKIPFECILSNNGMWFTELFKYLGESFILNILVLCMPEDQTFVFWMYNGCFLSIGRNSFISLTPAHIGWVARVRYIFRTLARLLWLLVSFSCVGFTLLLVQAKVSTHPLTVVGLFSGEPPIAHLLKLAFRPAQCNSRNKGKRGNSSTQWVWNWGAI